MDIREHKSRDCGNCGKKLNVHAEAHGLDLTPREGDLNLCGFCCAISKYDENLDVVLCSENDLDIIRLAEPEHWRQLQRVVTAIKMARDEQSGHTQ